MKYKIAQIIPYFGKWPEWIDLYFFSCGQNPMIDFIFFTDCPIPKEHSANIIFNYCTFEEYKVIVSRKLRIDYNIKDAYKLCDLRPFFGYIHQDCLKEYDFWGFGDIDLILGDLTMVFQEKILNNYEVITTHNYHLAGHFSFFRNNEYFRNLCFKIKDWKQIIVADKLSALDEGDFSNLVCPYFIFIRRLHKYFFKPLRIHLYKTLDIFNPIFHKKIYLHEHWTSLQPQNGQEWIYDCKKGCVTDFKNRELPYIHFLFFKKNPWLKSNIYWKSDFYNISLPINNYRFIIINNNCIKGIEYDKK